MCRFGRKMCSVDLQFAISVGSLALKLNPKDEQPNFCLHKGEELPSTEAFPPVLQVSRKVCAPRIRVRCNVLAALAPC